MRWRGREGRKERRGEKVFVWGVKYKKRSRICLPPCRSFPVYKYVLFCHLFLSASCRTAPGVTRSRSLHPTLTRVPKRQSSLEVRRDEEKTTRLRRVTCTKTLHRWTPTRFLGTVSRSHWGPRLTLSEEGNVGVRKLRRRHLTPPTGTIIDSRKVQDRPTSLPSLSILERRYLSFV